MPYQPMHSVYACDATDAYVQTLRYHGIHEEMTCSPRIHTFRDLLSLNEREVVHQCHSMLLVLLLSRAQFSFSPKFGLKAL